MDFSYFNSGLYIEAFYKEHYVDFFAKDRYLFEDVEYNRELLSEYYKEELEYSNEEYEKEEEIDRIFSENLSYYLTYFEPSIFNEEIALKCGLTPFDYQGTKLLALSACGMNLAYKLDAYQVLTDNTIDPESKIFTSSFQRERFERIVGKKITQKILNITKNQNKIQAKR